MMRPTATLIIVALFAPYIHGFTSPPVKTPATHTGRKVPCSLSSSSQPASENEKHVITSNKKNNELMLELKNEENEKSRREFLSSMIGAVTVATVFALDHPEKAEAAVLAEDLTAKKPMEKGSVSTTSSSLLSSSASASASSSPTTDIDYQAILKKSAKKALGGGKAGASAAVVQVCSLMWLRTSMNYQYRYGGDLATSLKTLTKEGGIPRLYQGLPFALVQGPMTRFGDTAANIGILALLESFDATAGLPLPVRTLAGSVAAGLWRILLMPIDASKTVMQVEGADGLSKLWTSVKEEASLEPLYQGALASAAATAVGHFPWFLTYNYLDDALPAVSKEEDLLLYLSRSALMGLSAACVSDCCSNSLRVIKTTKQTAQIGKVESDKNDSSDEEKKKGNELSYGEALTLILEKDGWSGLLGRGLKTRLLTNAIQGAVFSVLWKYFQNVGGMQ